MSLTELSPETCVLCISEALVWGGAHSLDTLLGSAQPGQCTPNPHFNKGRLAWLLHLCHQGACVTPRRKGLSSSTGWPVGGPGVVGALLHAAAAAAAGVTGAPGSTGGPTLVPAAVPSTSQWFP